MNKGAHVPITKTNLTDMERDVLAVLISGKELTSKEVSALSQHDIRETTFSLSTLVGMDLADVDSDSESKPIGENGEFISTQPKYFIKKGTPIAARANYALSRGNRMGVTLWHIINKKMQFDQRYWPDRPVDRLDFEGVVRISEKSGKPVVVIFQRPNDLVELVGRSCKIRVTFN